MVKLLAKMCKLERSKQCKVALHRRLEEDMTTAQDAVANTHWFIVR
jgi:hypothetical protein